MTITEFLTARYDEDEAAAQEVTERAITRGVDPRAMAAASNTWMPDDIDAVAVDAARILADIAAKRAIVAYAPRVDHLVSAIEWEYSSNVDEEGDDLLRILAQPFAEHPDFDPAWRVA
jgi:hypothetical protein